MTEAIRGREREPMRFIPMHNPLEEQGDPVASARASARRQAKEAEASRASRDRDEQWRIDTQAKVKRLSLIASVTVALSVAVTLVSAGFMASAARTTAELKSNAVTMLCAKRDLARGESVTGADLIALEVPVKFAPSDYLTEADLASLGEGGAAQVLLSPVSANNPLARSALSGMPSNNDLPQNIRSGYVGLTLQLDAASGVASLLRVGDEVDVVAATDDKMAATIASGVRVVALERQLSGSPDDGYELVTLELSPADVSLVAAAASPKLVARSALDTKAQTGA